MKRVKLNADKEKYQDEYKLAISHIATLPGILMDIFADLRTLADALESGTKKRRTSTSLGWGKWGDEGNGG